MLFGLPTGLVAPGKSIVSAKAFKIVFIAADFFSLILQGAGGGIAATANTTSGSDIGRNIILAGIIVQRVVMVGFVGYALYWGSRARQEGVYASRELKLLVLGMMMCSVMIVRGVCRTAELSGGFKGSLAQNQTMFLLDAIPISIAALSINLWHPGRLLRSQAHASPRTSSSSPSTFIAMESMETGKVEPSPSMVQRLKGSLNL